MIFKNNDGLETGAYLQDFRDAIFSFLRRRGFRNCDEDVADDMVASQWKRMRGGSAYRPHGMFLPEVLKREAFRKAKGASSLKTIGKSELNEIQSPEDMEEESFPDRELMSALEEVFKATEIEGMIGAVAVAVAVAAGSDRLRDLAWAAGMSERTFRTRLRSMGVAPTR